MDFFVKFVKYTSLIALVLLSILALLSAKPFQYLWSFINFITLLVHIGLIVSPVPQSIHQMMTEFFPWVSLTGITFIDFMTGSMDFSTAPSYNSAYWQLGYKTINASENAGSINTLILLPFVLTALQFLFRALAKFQKLAWFGRFFIKIDTLFALWIRVYLQLFFVMGLISLQMLVKGHGNDNYPYAPFSDSGLSGDFMSEVLKYYALVLASVAFLVLTGWLAYKHLEYAKMYKSERLAVYANELIYAYNASEDDIIARQRRKSEIQYDLQWWSMQEIAIRDSIF